MSSEGYTPTKRFRLKSLPILFALTIIGFFSIPFIINRDFAGIYLSKDKQAPKKEWRRKLEVEEGDHVYIRFYSRDKQGIKIGRFYVDGKDWGVKNFEPGEGGYEPLLDTVKCLAGNKLKPGEYELRFETEDPNGGVNKGLAKLVVKEGFWD